MPVHLVVFFWSGECGVLLQGVRHGQLGRVDGCALAGPSARDPARGRWRPRGRAHLPARIGWRGLVVVAFAASIGFAFRCSSRLRRSASVPFSQ
jgi:hypothetical protein